MLYSTKMTLYVNNGASLIHTIIIIINLFLLLQLFVQL